ncbi:snoRNA-binding rRNA-processing protein IMP4 [Ascoidea rubescens DSM 1968]|uniref:U3 small nucleolar ribonucleoprotein protein IMP4 n=1 Tax=Ascoidea rubescens DSM 1968 TaxID=1344418 RepID=A0A1D2VQ40_9ASCO|nr:Brix-domain-containing protein [Ascoidea rubescens DSM 1968]ODV63716.1 Brix-domain-containing protein [Ascoidea rubescens DSM 1968]
MIRKQARERREYLYRKAQELQDASLVEKRFKLKKALELGKPLPREIADDEKLKKDFIYDESIQDQSLIDDEYSLSSGIVEPKIIITTSRDPSTKLSQFSKEVKLLFPNSIRLNRGNYIMSSLVNACKAANATDIIILHEHRGVPTSLTVSHLPHGPTAFFSLHNVVLRHDIPNASNQSEKYPHLIFENFTSKLGVRATTILKNLFPPGVKPDSNRLITFNNDGDFINVRQHTYIKSRNDLEIQEIGPRFEMRLYELRLGTLDNKDADVEWQLRRFVRTANRKDYLAD